MKKKIIIAFMAAIGLSAIMFMRQNPIPEHLTDLQLENIEAIANYEDYDKYCVPDIDEECEYPTYDKDMRIIYKRLFGYRKLVLDV